MEEVVGSAVEAGGRDDLFAGLRAVQDSEGAGGLAGTDGHRSLAMVGRVHHHASAIDIDRRAITGVDAHVVSIHRNLCAGHQRGAQQGGANKVFL